MMSGDDSTQLTLLQDTLWRMEQQLSIVCTDVKELKHRQPPERVGSTAVWINNLVQYRVPWHKVSFLCQSSVLIVLTTALVLQGCLGVNEWSLRTTVHSTPQEITQRAKTFPDTFTAPRLDKMMAAECFKSTKSTDQAGSRHCFSMQSAR